MCPPTARIGKRWFWGWPTSRIFVREIPSRARSRRLVCGQLPTPRSPPSVRRIPTNRTCRRPGRNTSSASGGSSGRPWVLRCAPACSAVFRTTGRTGGCGRSDYCTIQWFSRARTAYWWSCRPDRIVHLRVAGCSLSSTSTLHR